MWTKILINMIASNLTKEIVELLLDKIAESLQNKATKKDTNKLKSVL